MPTVPKSGWGQSLTALPSEPELRMRVHTACPQGFLGKMASELVAREYFKVADVAGLGSASTHTLITHLICILTIFSTLSK